MPTVGTGGVGTDTISTRQFLQPAPTPARSGIIIAGPASATASISADLGTLVGTDFPTPAIHNVVVRLDLAGGARDPSLPTVTVAADGTFTLAGVPTGVAYRLSALWRTGIPGVPVQTITFDPVTITADTDLVDLLTP